MTDPYIIQSIVNQGYILRFTIKPLLRLTPWEISSLVRSGHSGYIKYHGIVLLSADQHRMEVLILELWGLPTVDFFATFHNSQLPKFNSRVQSTGIGSSITALAGEVDVHVSPLSFFCSPLGCCYLPLENGRRNLLKSLFTLYLSGSE